MNSNELWQAVLGELELSLSRANFTTWFKQTFISEMREHVLIVGVPNLFTKAWLEKKYTKEILDSLQELTSGSVKQITYRVEVRPNSPLLVQLFDPAMAREREEVQAQTHNTYQPRSDFEPQEIRTGEFSLNNKYCFSTFIVGKQNELAHAASQAACAQPGGVYNPLFIYGGV